MNNTTDIDLDPGSSLLFHLETEAYLELVFLFSFLTGVSVLLLVFHISPLHRLTRKIPASCWLIILGIVGAGIAIPTGSFSFVSKHITAGVFVNYLLPPIVLDGAFRLYTDQMLFNLDGVILLAFVGTTLNTFAMGLSLYGTFGTSNDLSVLQCLLLAAILSAVDPVAVLSVLGEVDVDTRLYILIFGESLLNDGVTIVLFDTIKKIAFQDVAKATYFFAVLSFVPVAIGGSLIGAVYGVLSSLAVKYTSRSLRIIEPTLILLGAYMSFLNAQVFHWSGILALIACGLVQKRYAFQSLGDESQVTIELGTSMLSSLAEATIFLIFGFKVLDSSVQWNWALIALTLFFSLLYRFALTFLIGWTINTYRLHKLTASQLFVMSYGGLRGAVSFAMAASLHHRAVKDLFMGTTLALILFTVLVQGSTVRLIVDGMHCRRKPVIDSWLSKVMKQVNFHVLAGMETILGGRGSTLHYWLERLDTFDKRVIRPLLCAEVDNQNAIAESMTTPERAQPSTALSTTPAPSPSGPGLVKT